MDEETQGMAAEAITPESEVANADDQRADAQPGEGASGAAEEFVEPENPYTKAELDELIKTDGVIDRSRLTSDQLAIQKTFEKGYQKKFQDLAKIRKEAEEQIAQAKPEPAPEPYFPDMEKNRVFQEFLKNPAQWNQAVNAEISRLEDVQPLDDDGVRNPAFQQARKTIAQWQAIKDEFMFKREEVSETKRSEEAVKRELGDKAPELEAYAKAIGFTASEFRTKTELRSRIKRLYDLSAADQTANGKEVKPKPPKLSVQSGYSGKQNSDGDIFNPKLATEDRIALFRKNKNK